jgi:hypothetical protein
MSESPRSSRRGFVPWCWVAALAAIAVPPPAAPAPAGQEPAVAPEPDRRAGENYLVVPTATELQRYYCRDYREVDAFVFVNAMDPVGEDSTVLDAGAIDLEALGRSLAPYAERDPPGSVVFVLPPIEEADMGDVLASMQRSASRLKPSSRHRVMLLYHSKDWDAAETRAAVAEITGEAVF